MSKFKKGDMVRIRNGVDTHVGEEGIIITVYDKSGRIKGLRFDYVVKFNDGHALAFYENELEIKEEKVMFT